MPETESPPRCANCDRPLDGGFCSQCGQSGKDYDLPVGEFAKEFASETLSLDSRLRLTLQLLFLKPGAVPKGYVAGHRARFVPPIRLYVFASFAMFLMLSFTPGVVNIDEEGTDAAAEALIADTIGAQEEPEDTTGAGAGTSSTWAQQLGERFLDSILRASADRERFTELILARMGQAMFFLLPVFAALLKLVYRGRLYVHHLVFSIYFHSFVFLLLALASIPTALGLLRVAAVTDVSILWIPVYLFLGMRRFYGKRWAKTKFALVSVVYWLLGTMTVGALFFVSLMTF